MKVLSALLVAVTLIGTMTTDVEAKKPRAPLVVPLTGTGGTFNGTFSITRFEAQDGVIYAVGMIAGVVTGVGSVVHGPIALETTITGGTLPASTGGITPQQVSCEVLHLVVGGVTVNLLGLDVALSPVTLDIVGGTGPLGELICQIVALLDNVVAVVGLLNQLLGLLLDLLGGLTPGA